MLHLGNENSDKDLRRRESIWLSVVLTFKGDASRNEEADRWV